MKKIISLLLILLLFTSCSAVPKTDDGFNIVCLSFAEYDWTREIINGTDVNINLLIDNGVDAHSFQPTVEDIVKLSTADLLIFNGGASDGWVEDAVKEAQNEKIEVLRLIDFVETLPMPSAEEHNHTGDCHHEADEHIWLSLNNAKILSSQIANKLASLNPQNKTAFEKNLKNYTEKLTSLDGAYRQAVASAKGDKIVVADRFPFVYLTADYGINYVSAFGGCSADTDASFDTVLRLAGQVENTLVVTEKDTSGVSDAVIKATGRQIEKIVLNSMQSVTLKEAEKGVTYYSISEQNLSALKKALG